MKNITFWLQCNENVIRKTKKSIEVLIMLLYTKIENVFLGDEINEKTNEKNSIKYTSSDLNTNIN